MSEAVQPTLTDEEMDRGLPHPSGYKMLIALPTVDKTFGASGLLKADQTVANETITSVIALVLEVGPDAYADKDKFPSGPWCKAGDYVLVRPYTGTRFSLNNKEFRIINDDSIEGVVADPSGYRRI